VENGIARLDVGEEGVSQSLTLGRALYKAGDVNHVQICSNFTEIYIKLFIM
jgi:hypothetical protein